MTKDYEHLEKLLSLEGGGAVKSHKKRYDSITRVFIATTIVAACAAIFFLLAFVNEEGNTNFKQSQDIAYGVALKQCVQAANNGNKFDCNKLSLDYGYADSPSIICRNCIPTTNFAYKTGDGASDFTTRIMLNRFGDVTEHDFVE
jgi:hypothetical protein